MWELIKASQIQPGDKFNIMGMDLFVIKISRSGCVIHVDLENRRTVGTDNLTWITSTLIFNVDTYIEKPR